MHAVGRTKHGGNGGKEMRTVSSVCVFSIVAGYALDNW